MSKSQPSYLKPDSLAEACDVLSTRGKDAKVVAGGQSLSLLLRQDLLDPAVIVDISELSELGGIEVDSGRVSIGATATYSSLASHDITDGYRALGDAVAVIGDVQVRNLGTIGGAVAHADPSLDILPALLCADAELGLAGPDGRRSVPFEEFYEAYMQTALDDGEILAEITFDLPTEPYGSAYEKYANVDGGWAIVGVNSLLELSDDGSRIETARLALTAVDDTPVRAPSAETRLEGTTPSENVLDDAADAIPADINPLEDISGSIEYKETLAVRLGRRSLDRALERATGVISE